MANRYRLWGPLAFAMALAQPAAAGSLNFAADVPQPPKALPLLRLTLQPAPTQLVDRLLSQSRSAARLAPLSEAPLLRNSRASTSGDVLVALKDEHARAWVNRRTGDAYIYPDLDNIEALSQGVAADQASSAEAIFNSADFIARDDTRVVVGKPDLLEEQTLTRDANGEVRTERQKAPYLAYFSARRFVGDLPVDGPGSRALLVLGGRGSVEGLTRVWKSARTVRTVLASRSAEQVRAEIARQLRQSLASADVTVDRIELAYYDAGRDFLQPVYRFAARIHHSAAGRTSRRTGDDFVIGYVPFAQAFEPLPVLGQGTGPRPTAAAAGQKAPRSKGAAPASLGPIVGRYVVRNDDAGWVNDANAFWGSLSSSATGGLFTDAQYYWAEPRLFTTEKDSFVNAMNLALTEVHGDWWFFTTYQNWGDGVRIDGDIPSPGYGPAANGSLADWILHSCEVVPTPDDTASWADPWWTVFGGVRNVVGYRTIMYINDGAGGPYGASLGNLAPVVSSWLSDVMSLNAYSGGPTDTAHGGVVRPMGRPSAISACGHDSDTALSTSPLDRADCLNVYWFPD